MKKLRLPVFRRKKLSFVVVVYNIPREAPRTLFSLSAAYQRHIDPDDYEIIIVDNGSNPPFDRNIVKNLSGNFRIFRMKNASASPVKAINTGIAHAKGDIVGVMIDGARILSPGVFHFACHAAYLYDYSVVATPGYYLGYDLQRLSMLNGYNQDQEDALLDSMDWKEDGYRLFEISTLDEPSKDEPSKADWFHNMSESNALFMRKKMWTLLGGFNEAFDAPAGGLVNLDTYKQAVELPNARVVVLSGEGTFHQFHGGISTNISLEDLSKVRPIWNAQYKKIRGKDYERAQSNYPTSYIGTLPECVRERFALSNFFHNSYHIAPHLEHSDPKVQAVLELIGQEYEMLRFYEAVSLARLLLTHMPDEFQLQQLLFNISFLTKKKEDPGDHFLLTMGEAHRILGDNETALSYYKKALLRSPNLTKAFCGMASIRLPGDNYYVWLERFYTRLKPDIVIEIGVASGASLAKVSRPTIAIGVDPNPCITHPLNAETYLFTETSDAFFARDGLSPLLSGRRISIGFIDGLHLYEQVLRDFIHLEKQCSPTSIILLHDTIPLNEATQCRARDTNFHTGDVWKIIPCLKYYRPDLDIFTIATPMVGLTVIAGLYPDSNILSESYDEAVSRFIDLPYSTLEYSMESVLNIIPNDWDVVQERLKKRGCLDNHPSAIATLL